MRMTHRKPGLLRDTRGATAVEYGLILACLVLVMVTALSGFGNSAIVMWNTTASRVSSATNQAAG